MAKTKLLIIAHRTKATRAQPASDPDWQLKLLFSGQSPLRCDGSYSQIFAMIGQVLIGLAMLE